jgi:DNA-binding transcriptional MocR family regulator
MWIPNIDELKGPQYLAIAEALDRDIRAGLVEPGQRLPTHRALATALGVSIGTVTRAYAEATKRALVDGTVGRGTFVRDRARDGTGWALDPGPHEAHTDLSLLMAPQLARGPLADLVREGLVRAMESADLEDVMGYQQHTGHPRHRAAATRWLERCGLEATSDQVLICASAQHACSVTYSVLAGRDDTVLTEELTSPGIKDLAAWLQFRLRGVACDEFGLIPEAFEAACLRTRARVLHTMPTLQNPTTVTLSEDRRREIAEIAERHGVAIVEDGVHDRMASSSIRPLSHFAPLSSYYFTSLSKSVAPGVRIGFLKVPDSAVRRVEDAIRASLWMSSPLLAEVATQWIDDGTAEAVLEDRTREARARVDIAHRTLHGYGLRAADGAFHTWLPLPDRWEASAFVQAARRRRVLVTPAEVFMADRGHVPSAVRICLGGTPTRGRLTEALTVLRTLLDSGPEEEDADHETVSAKVGGG